MAMAEIYLEDEENLELFCREKSIHLTSPLQVLVALYRGKQANECSQGPRPKHRLYLHTILAHDGWRAPSTRK